MKVLHLRSFAQKGALTPDRKGPQRTSHQKVLKPGCTLPFPGKVSKYVICPALHQIFRLKWPGGGAQALVFFKTSSNDPNKQPHLRTTTLKYLP